MTAPTIVAKKSYRDGCVTISVRLKSSGFGDGVRVEGSTELTTEASRELARSLIELADQADARTASKTAAEDRRRKWRDREVAAGRMVVFRSLR